MARTYKCPRCRARAGVDILYGEPTIEAFEAAERGEIHLGGCVMELGAPDRHCRNCGHEWRKEQRLSAIDADIRAREIAGDALRLILDAASFAADKHRMQRRKDAEASPYINHPLALARILATEGGVSDPEVIAAALLHDTVEDTDTSLDEIAARFGDRVAGMVAEVTDDKALPKAERKRRQVANAAKKSTGAKLVKLADKISNLRDIAASPPADWSEERKDAYFAWAREVVAGLRGVNGQLEAAFDRACQLRVPQRHSE